MKRGSINRRIGFVFALMVLLFIFMGGISVFTANLDRREAMEETQAIMIDGQKEKLKVAASAMAITLSGVLKEIPQESERLRRIPEIVNPVLFGEDRTGYFFVYRGTVNVAQPLNPAQQGQDLGHVKTPDGRSLVGSTHEIARSGGGFVEYQWPKPGKGDQPKIAYAEMIPDTDFWIGASLYMDTVQEKKREIADRLRKKSDERHWRYLGLAALILSMALVPTMIFSSRSITRPLRAAIDRLNDVAAQLAAAAGQIATSSQSLSSGASQQAAAVEETSSALEELSATTRQNADHAASANTIREESARYIEKAEEVIRGMSAAMSDVATASKETQKIVGTIDEIAFQTNLLALNAAVEAARAGEAGAGFAVVAEEVRNLAMRAGEAARNTAGMIESTVKQIQNGAEMAEQTREAFGTVTDSSGKIGELVSEIAAASREQAQGIEQINQTVSDMERGVQQNAANAQETASAAEQLNSQAGELAGLVVELNQLLGMAKTGHVEWNPEKRNALSTPPPSRTTEPPAFSSRKKSGGREGREVTPEERIPFEDDDFDDF